MKVIGFERIVVDASVVVAWLFDDEEEPRADRVLERLEAEFYPEAQGIPTGVCLLGRQLGEDDPRLFLPVVPALSPY